MLLGYMTGFAGYLNDNGYEVTQDKISRFLSLKNEDRVYCQLYNSLIEDV